MTAAGGIPVGYVTLRRRLSRAWGWAWCGSCAGWPASPWRRADDVAGRRSRWSSSCWASCSTSCSPARTSGRASGSCRRARASGDAPRPRPRRDGARVGGQPRLAHLRAHGRRGPRIRPRSGRSPRRSWVALFLAGLGIIVRGAAYALRSGRADAARVRRVDTASAVSSMLTPFALGAAVGGLASGRVPYGNAAGDLITSWLNPTSILSGRWRWPSAPTWPRSTCAPMPAGAASPTRAALPRPRALAAGVVAGAPSSPGCRPAPRRPVLYHELVSGDGLPALVVRSWPGWAPSRSSCAGASSRRATPRRSRWRRSSRAGRWRRSRASCRA